MQVYALKLFNFFRFHETNNSVIFDMLPEYENLSVDEIYDKIKKDPLSHIGKVKGKLTGLISIAGIIGNDFDNSNGSGKSTLLEGICYALYDKIVRKNLQVDSIEKAGASVITKINGEYPEDLKETYVEIIFEESNKVYLLKRGRVLSKSDKDSKRSPKPILEFKCISEKEEDSQSGHRTGDTNDQIAKVINLDYDLFCSSVMFAQGSDGGKFLTGTDSTRKEMLISLLRLENVVSGCLEKVRERKNAKEKEINSLNAQISLMSDGLKTKQPIDVLKQQILEKEKAIVENNNQSKTCGDEIEVLSKSDSLKELEAIKSEGQKIQNDLAEKKKQKDGRIQEWSILSKNVDETISKKINDINDLELKIKEISEKLAANKQKIESFNLETNKKSLDTVEKAKQHRPKCEEIVKELRKQDIEINRTVAVLLSNLEKNKKEIFSLQKQIDNAGNKSEFICDKCKSVVNKRHIENELAKNTQESNDTNNKIEKSNEEQGKLHIQIREQENKLIKINDWIAKEGVFYLEVQQYENNKAKQIELTANQEEHGKIIEKYRNEKSELERQKIQYQNKIAEIGRQYDVDISALNDSLELLRNRYKAIDESAKNLKSKIETLRIKIEEITRTNAANNSQIGSLKKEIEGIEENTKKLKEINKKMAEENAIFNRLVILDSCFGLDGIQTRIISKYLPLLNVYIKEFMDVLSDEMMTVTLQINNRSKIDIVIKGGTASSYEMLSGGEKMLCRLSVSVGLAMLSFTRCSQKPEIIALDEIFSPLDPSHVETVFKLLKKLKNKFNRVLIISHSAAINERIPNQILVEKDPGMAGRSRIRKIV